MLPVQMADNSFNSNEPVVIKPVKSESLKDEGKFSDIYESVSSIHVKKMETGDDRLPAEEIAGESSKRIPVENKKLISLKKVNP